MTQPTTAIPVVSIVGKSDSGKTTLLEKLVRVLTARGWRVGTVKHHVHGFDIDLPGKDSWRHARAGAFITMISSPIQFASIQHVEHERTLEELATFAAEAGADLLLTEGYKSTATARIEVSRRGRSEELISTRDELMAVATDNPELDLADVPTFGLDDADAVATLIERLHLGVRAADSRPSTSPGAGERRGD